MAGPSGPVATESVGGRGSNAGQNGGRGGIMLAAETAQAVLTDSVSVFVSVFLNLLIHLLDMKKILKI